MRLEMGVRECVRRGVASRIQVHLRISAILSCALLSLVPEFVRAQGSPSFAGNGERIDIVTENLKRVAATAEQILDILNRNTGLMVELKRWIAQDAGESGQVLEESDLNDNALAQRLNQDLRTRVIATRLLRRYGYLLPQLNPDSDQAQEQNLVLQERAHELARAAERRDGLSGPASLRHREIQSSPRGPRVDTAGQS